MLINPGKYVLYNLLLALLLVLFNPFSKVFSASNVPTYFDFEIPKPFTTSAKEINLKLHYDLGTISEQRFRFRPHSEKSSVKIKGEHTIEANELWTLMPPLSDVIKLELGGNFIFTNLWLAVLDTKTGQIYETPQHKIWNGGILLKYLNALNANILK